MTSRLGKENLDLERKTRLGKEKLPDLENLPDFSDFSNFPNFSDSSNF